MNKNPIHRNAGQDYYHSNTNFPWRRVAGKGDQESANYEEDNWQNDGDLYRSFTVGAFVAKPEEARYGERGEQCLNEADIIDQHVDILYHQECQGDNAEEDKRRRRRQVPDIDKGDGGG